MKLNEKITKIRKENGLSQEEFGNKINVSRQAVSKWESEQTKPDIDKIKEIAKTFGVSFEYLLNDEIEEKNVEPSNLKGKSKKKKHLILRIVLILLLIYLLISLYKFIALYRYYKMASSFSEKNYWMNQTYSTNGVSAFEVDIKKVGNKRIEKSSATQNNIENEDASIILTNRIDFLDVDKKVCYRLSWNKNDTSKVYYYDNKEETTNEEELNELLNIDKNEIRDYTLSCIPSDFTSILLKSINPMCYIDTTKNTIYENYINGMKIRIVLTKDGLVENYSRNTEFDGNMSVGISYDYVQDHFSEIQDPLEIYKEKIIYNT